MTIAVTPSDITALFPEFGPLDPALIQTWIDEATPSVNETQWAGKAESAVKFLTAHFLSVFAGSDGSGTGSVSSPGPVTSEREGQVQASYGVAGIFTSNDLGSTKYGRRYLAMLKAIFVTRVI